MELLVGVVQANFIGTGARGQLSQCPLLALSGHGSMHRTCPLMGVKRTWAGAVQMSAFDPKRTSTIGAFQRVGDGTPLVGAQCRRLCPFGQYRRPKSLR